MTGTTALASGRRGQGQYRRNLPVFRHFDEIVRAVTENQTIVVQGSTGSGKTTQIPQYLFGHGFAVGGLQIVCTQPRRLAAISLASRVAREMGGEVGDLVGYSVRFEKELSDQTRVKFTTAGQLAQEILWDPLLAKYAVVIIDEAHDRPVEGDMLMAQLQRAMCQRRDLKVVIMSATINASVFQLYFANAKLVSIAGRTFPVQLFYAGDCDEDRYVQESVEKACELFGQTREGHILVFFTGKGDIDKAYIQLESRLVSDRKNSDQPPPKIMKLYGKQSPYEQNMVTRDVRIPGSGKNYRKVICTTNVGEASITVNNVGYVVDCGLAKENTFDIGMGGDTLVTKMISKASADQRKGRAGRTCEGFCHRIYSEIAFETMADTTTPDIMRSDPVPLLLNLLTLNYSSFDSFGFLDSPSDYAQGYALGRLKLLGAVGDDGLITEKGRIMSKFPVHPDDAASIYQAADFGCAFDTALVVAITAEDSDILVQEWGTNTEKRRLPVELVSDSGDCLTTLNVYEYYANEGRSEEWCTASSINKTVLESAAKTFYQLSDICEKIWAHDRMGMDKDEGSVLSAFLHGKFMNIAMRVRETEKYRTAYGDTIVELDRATSLTYFPQWVVYGSIRKTKKTIISHCVAIDIDDFLILNLCSYEEVYFNSSYVAKELVTIKQRLV